MFQFNGLNSVKIKGQFLFTTHFMAFDWTTGTSARWLISKSLLYVVGPGVLIKPPHGSF